MVDSAAKYRCSRLGAWLFSSCAGLGFGRCWRLFRLPGHHSHHLAIFGPQSGMTRNHIYA